MIFYFFARVHPLSIEKISVSIKCRNPKIPTVYLLYIRKVCFISILFCNHQTALISSTYKAIEMMREDNGGKGGTVINISSVAALIQFSPTAFVYAGTKSAVLYFSNCIGVSFLL